MRVHEVLLDRRAPDGRVVVHESARGVIGGVAHRDRLHIVEGADARGQDLLLVKPDDIAALPDLLSSVSDGVTAVVALTVPLRDVPVGALVTAVVDAGWQVQDLVPVRQSGVSTLVFLHRGDAVLAPRGYLRPEVREPASGDAGVRRVVAEWVIASAVARAHDVEQDAALARAQAQIDALNERLDSAKQEIARGKRAHEKALARIDELESSEALAAGRALAEMRKHPLRGTSKLLRVARRGND